MSLFHFYILLISVLFASFIHNNSLKLIKIGYHVIVFNPIYRWLWFFFKCIEEVVQPVASNSDSIIIFEILSKSGFVSHNSKSFIKLLSRIGPSIEPCGILKRSVLKKLDILLIFTLCFHTLLTNHGETLVSKSRSYACSLAVRRSCGIQSNAFDKSIKTALVKRLWSNACLQFPINRIKVWFVLCPLPYADIC